MIARRELLIGSACLLAAGAAYGLKPRRRMSLLGEAKLDQIVPGEFAGWSSRGVTDLVAPRTEGSLAARLYGQLVERIYHQASSGAEVMMLLAHGDTESDELQLHRPESCYPAAGFELTSNLPAHLSLPGRLALPVRRLVATVPGRRENIVYWSRLGEFLPIDEGQQRLDRLRTAMSGYVADGLLARFSTLGSDSGRAWTLMDDFVQTLLRAIPKDKLNALVGTARARAMAAAGAE